jgi:hypothetical protein
MQSHYTYQDTNISLKTGTKNIRRSTPTRDQNSPLETQVENPNQDANLAAGFAILSTILNKLNLINMPSPTKDYIVRKATSLQNKGKRHSTTTTPATGNHRKIILEKSRTKWGDVLDLQELEAVLEHIHGNASNYERVSPRTTISSHSRIGRGITRYPARNHKAAQCRSPAQVRKTWLHLLNPSRIQ